jgi:hypothetical protein
MAVIGILLSIFGGGVGYKQYSKAVASIPPIQLILIASLPLIISTLLILRAAIAHVLREKKEYSLFISDNEKTLQEEDFLDFSESAARFAERIFNGGSRDSLVFGIDAPWGIGKSSFVNFCTEYWNKNQKEKVIVYRFNPLRYEDRSHLLEKFVDGLVQAIQKHVFIPEIKPIVSRYSRFIKGKGAFSLFGVDFDLLASAHSIEDAFADLESVLAELNKKIIVVVDDLDRLPFSAIEDILFTIKKSFTLPNVTYILCYDTDNIAVPEKKEKDTEKIREFLEKFVNVKVSLFLDTDNLANYITINFEKAIRKNLQLDPYTLEKIKEAISEIKEIYKSPDFHHYQDFLGDIRKLKRLINTLILFEIEKTDFENSDFNKRDLINLLLIYINYPKVFRKIFNTETDGKRGFFSVVSYGEKGYPVLASESSGIHNSRERGYKNSVMYSEYIKQLTVNQKFLLDQVFLAPENADSFSNRDNKKLESSSACFNGTMSSGRNLEQYLNLIVKLSKPLKRGQQQFYLNAKDDLSKGVPIENILSAEEFSFLVSEDSRQQFWRVVVNSAREFNSHVGDSLITYLLAHFQDYSLISVDKIGLGLRDDLSYLLLFLLDRVGWSTASGSRSPNTPENIREIADRIFGEGRHQGQSIVDTLGAKERGVLGLFDLMLFRLSCSADRGGDTFNLQRALSLHGDPKAPTEGPTNIIAIEEMREISQRVFRIFQDQYITPKENLFDRINALTVKDLLGKYSLFVDKELAAGKLKQEELEKAVAVTKSRITGFVVYQLGNSLVSSGVGCGYYDVEGKNDSKGISESINSYLFEECFNPSRDERNYENFLDYLLINLSNTFSSSSDFDYTQKPYVGEFTKVLSKERLVDYWKKNRKIILEMSLNTKEKQVVTSNYTATYKKHLNEVYSTLDVLIHDVEELK